MGISPEDAERHSKLFQEASAYVMSELPYHGRRLGKPGLWLARRMNKALRLYDQVLAINPHNWSALWLQGMVLRRLERFEEALAKFVRAGEINPTQPDIAREAGITAGLLGRRELSLELAMKASTLDPDDAGLLSNVALEALLLGRVEEAVALVTKALAKDPGDPVTQSLHQVALHVAERKAPPPASLRELELLATRLKAERGQIDQE